MRAPVVSRKTSIFALVTAAPFVALCIWALVVVGPPALAGIAFFGGLVILPIALAVRMGRGAGNATDRRLRARQRALPPCPPELTAVEDLEFDLDSVDLPLTSRPLTTMWSKAVTVVDRDAPLKLFQVIHADLRGEGSWSDSLDTAGLGMTVLTCVLTTIDADMPLVVVRPRREKAFTLPPEVREFGTELERFNRDFRLYSEVAYGATAIVDQRTMAAIQGFDPGTSIEIGGGAIVVFSSRPDVSRLVQQAASLRRTFPSVVRSFYPAEAT